MERTKQGRVGPWDNNVKAQLKRMSEQDVRVVERLEAQSVVVVLVGTKRMEVTVEVSVPKELWYECWTCTERMLKEDGAIEETSQLRWRRKTS